EGLALELRMCAVFVALQERREALRRIPAVEGVAKVLGTAQIAEPDATLSTTPHKRGMEIMPPWPRDVHTWPSPWPRIWSTTEMDGHAHSMRRQKPSSVPPDVFGPQNRQCATVCAAKSRTIAQLGSSRSNGRVENEIPNGGVWPARPGPACPCACGDCQAPHESS